MKELELALRALQAANLATPAIVAVIQAVKDGSRVGQSDDDIIAHALSVANETKTITEKDMSDEP